MIDWTKFLPNARHVATLPRLKPRTAICRLNVVQIGFRQFLWLRKQMAFAPHEWKPVICDVAAFRNIQFFPASKLKDLLMLLSPNPQVAGPRIRGMCHFQPQIFLLVFFKVQGLWSWNMTWSQLQVTDS